jgi:hypothetical protein
MKSWVGNSRPVRRAFGTAALGLMLSWTVSARAQSCASDSDLDEATRAPIVNTAKRYFDMVAKGDASGLRQNSIASLASDFTGIDSAVKDNQVNFAGAQPAPRSPFLLKAEGTAPLERAEFLCGVFRADGQTANSAVFVIPNLPPGTYAIDVLDVTTPNGAYTVSFVLQQQGSEWKLGGLYMKASQVAGHDGKWFADQARVYKGKGQVRNAWFYFLEARELLSPVPFMSTLATDKLYDEMEAVKPSDLPSGNSPIDLTVGAKVYKLVAIFPEPVGTDLDVVVKYQAADVSNTTVTFQENMVVIKALVGKYPEYRDAFAGVVARAVEPSGRDYGSLLPMKEIK